ncbi:type VI toxin-antitoxin system SocA family antitoxin [Endosaccharibacter trunci]|uniref:type VI toxin-antitoxin system SocA family antitoxin n=1 Tax=Endosaccharibacter trunci TaxID=2812733 RepID=UPI003BF4D792
MSAPYDPRIVANLLLDVADEMQTKVSNLALQKLLYFSHAHLLIERKFSLIRGGFEAWKYGPVQPAVYLAFRSNADRAICTRAVGRNVITGVERSLPKLEHPLVRHYIKRVVTAYGRMTPGRLVELTHASNAPWHYVVKIAENSPVLGRHIGDDVISARFAHHKIPIGLLPTVGEPSEDTPITGY